MEREEVRCPLCGVRPERVVRRARSVLDDVPGTYEVRACPACGLWATSPRPRREDLSLVYPPGYHHVGVPDDRFPPAAEVRGTLLDVGCGTGDYLVIARSEGWRGLGIDVSEEAAAIARSRGFEVLVGDALEIPFPGERFDRVRCSHTLEHVPEPERLLTRLREAVKEDGMIEVIVPNRASAASAVFRSHWYHLDVPRHLWHFRPRDVRALAARTGLRVASVRHTASPSGLLGSVDRLVASIAGRRRTRLRSGARLRQVARVPAWLLARMGLADVVEYRLRRTNGPAGG